MARHETPRVRIRDPERGTGYGRLSGRSRRRSSRWLLHAALLAGVLGVVSFGVWRGFARESGEQADQRSAPPATAPTATPMAALPLVTVTPAGTAPAATATPIATPSPTITATPSPAPTARPVPGPTFVVNSLAVGCHSAPSADADIVARRDPGSILAMDQFIEQRDGVWHREANAGCWTRTDPGPIVCITESRQAAETCAQPFVSSQPVASPPPAAAVPTIPSAPRPAVVATQRPTAVATARTTPAAASQPSRPPAGTGGPAPAPAAPATSAAAQVWTVILHSFVIADGASRQEAEAEAAAIRAAGFDANVVNSSMYRSLRPGYWVVYSGLFSNQADARRAAAALRAAGFTDAYERQLDR